MHRHYKTTAFFTAVRVFGDLASVLLGFFLAYYVRFYSGVFPPVRALPWLSRYHLVFSLGTVLILLFLKSYGFYGGRWRFNFLKEFFLIIRGVTSGLFVMLALSFFYREFSYSRGLVLLVWPFAITFLAVFRWLVAKVEVGNLVARRILTRLAIIGTDEKALRLAESLRKNAVLGYDLVGFITGGEESDSAQHSVAPLLGSSRNLPKILETTRLDEVILARQGESHQAILSMFLECEKQMVTFKLVPDMFEILTSRVDITHVEGIPLLGFHEFPLQQAWNRIQKRLVDIVGSFLGLILLSPLMGLIALLVKRDSPGPVFFKQERCGQDGKIFWIVKFRTMVVGAEEQTGPVWAKPDDQRRTQRGSFLRRMNLDELPQLLNVLKGDMSLVGPRPERPHFVSKFRQDIPRYMARHHIRAGLTGWAQVNGLRGDTSIEERIKYDLYYIEHWSLFFDFKILLMTMFTNKNAY